MTSTPTEYSEGEDLTSGGMIEPIHVIVDGESETRKTPEFGSWQTISWPAGQSAVATAQPLLLQSRKRSKARVIIYSGAVSTVTATGAAAAGGNGSASLPAGASISSFLIAWGNVATANTVTVTVTNTITGASITYTQSLAIGANAPMAVNYSPVLGPATPASQITVTVTGNINSPTANILVQGISAQAATPAFVRVGTLAQVQGNAGGSLQPGTYTVENAHSLYVASDGVNAMTVVVLDERYL